MAKRARILASKVLRTNVCHRPSPSLFSFPGLNTQPFHNSTQFGFVKEFERNTSMIQKEYQALKKAYGDRDDYILNDGEHSLNKGQWSWMNYIEKGEIKKDMFQKYCPVTTALLDEGIGKDLMTGTPFSYTFLSTMKPQTSISPHHGASNIRLRCHFPLFVPEEAFLKVAGDARPWEEGKMVVFDDSYEHEAANLSETQERVILLIDLWHPDLIDEERKQIKSMFAKMQQMIKDRQGSAARQKTR